MSRHEQKKKKGKIKYVILTIVVLIILAVGGGFIFGYSLLGQIDKKELPKNDADLGIVEQPVEDKKDDVINIAFFGLDARNPDVASRSDSIMVVSIDKTNQKVKITSLMRDMYVPIPGKSDNRINAAYAFGGAELAVKTINTNFGLDIRNYVTVDFFGLEKLIDKVGGVKIDVSSAESQVLNGYIAELNNLNKNKVSYVNGGLQTLNGRQAVAYSRIRYVGHGDYERTERQREVLSELFKKIKSQGVTKLPGIVSTMLPYIQTSFSNGEILDLGTQVIKFNTDNLEQYRLPVDGTYSSQSIRGMSVLVPNINENKNKLHEFIYGVK